MQNYENSKESGSGTIKFGFSRKMALTTSLFSVVGMVILCISFYATANFVLSGQQNSEVDQILTKLGLLIGLLAVIISVISVFGSMIMGKIMTKSINKLNDDFFRLSMGEVDLDLQEMKVIAAKSQDEIGQMMTSFIKMVENQKALADAAQGLAMGDFNVEIKPRSEKDILASSLHSIIFQLNQLYNEMYKIGSETGNDGNFSYKSNAISVKGSYQDFIGGFVYVNGILIEKLQTATQIITLIGKGEIPAKITETYPGDFNLLKDSINSCIDGLGALKEGNMVLERMAQNDLSTDIEGEYSGIYGEIAKSVNQVKTQMLDIVEVFNRIAIGDLGDLKKLKNIGKLSNEDILFPVWLE